MTEDYDGDAGIPAALAELEAAQPGAFWILGKGRLSEREPLYGFQVLFGADNIIADGEGASATEAIRAAVAKLKTRG